MADPTPNPVAVDVNQDNTIRLTCVAHAAYQQKVTASFNADLSDPVAVFTGTGEGKAMKSGDEEEVAVFTGAKSKLYVLFQYSSGGDFQNALRVLPVKSGGITQITSEDANDRDDNDSYFTLVDEPPGS